jgi:type IV pilus assembly protein PilC
MAVDLAQIRSLELTGASTSTSDGLPRWRAVIRRRVSSRAHAVTTRQLATMVGAGLPIVHSLHLLAEQAEGTILRQTLRDLAQRVAAGSTLTETVESHPGVFPPLYASLVRAGELAGVLDAVLHRLAAHLEQSARLRRTVLGALAYPACVVAAAFVVSAILLVWVVPVFAGTFAGFGAELPVPTQIVLGLSNSLRAHAWLLGAAAVASGAALGVAGTTAAGKQLADRWVLRVPVLGDLLGKAAVARAVRTLGTLVASGVAILDALDVAARTAGNGTIADAFVRARASLSRGRSLAQPLGESPAIPPMVRQMIAVGEATGTLDVMLARVADLYDDEVHTAASNLLALLEPALMLFLGVVIGGLVVSMYLPIFRLGAVLG